MKIIYCFLFSATILIGNAPAYTQDLKADFSADNYTGCDELLVSFTDNSETLTETTYYWQFGNGQSSSLQNPSVVFDEPGTYSVSLTITDGDESDTYTENDCIIIHKGPVAGFIILQDSIGCAPYTINFEDKSTAGDAPLSEWHYDFNDGNTSDFQNLEHSYEFQNRFSPVLRVSDTNGCSDMAFRENYITVFKPTADFSVIKNNSCDGILSAQFTDLSESENPLNYQWNFGDGNLSESPEPEHVYSVPDSYDVSLRITDEYNCSDSLTKIDFINVRKIKADFIIEHDTVCLGQEISFKNTSVLAETFFWDFGDGNSSQQQSPKHTFSGYGTFSVQLIALSADGCSDTIQKNITVEEIHADFEQDISFACDLPVDISYTNKSVNADLVFWDFGNGYFSKETNPVITYEKQGIYNHKLKVKSKNGCTDSVTVSSALEIARPRAHFTPNNWMNVEDLSGCAPVQIQFENKSSYLTDKDSIVSFEWNFGDGSDSQEKNPSHSYGSVGFYTLLLEITTEKGCKSKFYAQPKVGEPQNPNFEKQNADEVCASEAVSFTDASEDAEKISNRVWFFGDGENSYKENPTHLYVDTGYMDVGLAVFHNGCRSDIVKEDFIYIKGPYVDINHVESCEEPYLAKFSGEALGAKSIQWSFGDNSPLVYDEFNPEHAYPGRGNYSLSVIAKNETIGCSYEVSQNVSILKSEASFLLSEVDVCAGYDALLSGEKSTDADYFYYNGQMGKYLWDFGDGSPKSISSKPLSHIYYKAGEHKVSLTVKDANGCYDTQVKNIKVAKPRVAFSLKEKSGCLPLKAVFENFSQSDYTIAKYLWTFGNGHTSVEENPEYSYEALGSYDVSLAVTDEKGCSDTLTKQDFVEVKLPNPEFSVSDSELCEGDSVIFQTAADDKLSSWAWDFGDGTQSSEPSPGHIYEKPGQYDVRLQLTDSRGCDSTLVKTAFVEVQTYPSAEFTADKTVFSCYPSEVLFDLSDDASGASRWKWDFGSENARSHLPEPVHTFVRPGSYDVSLMVSSSFGCKDSLKYKNYITVNGPYADIAAPDSVCKEEAVIFGLENKTGIYDNRWIFPDGSTDRSETTEYTFSNFDDHIVRLQLRADTLHTCDKLLSDTIHVRRFEANIQTENGSFEACMPYRAKFMSANTASIESQWFFGTGDSTISHSPIYTYAHDGTYSPRVIITDGYGCKDTAAAKITVHPLPDVHVSPDTLICEGGSARLHASGARSYLWFPDINLSDNRNAVVEARPQKSKMYFVEGTDENGCKSQEPVYITVAPKPELFLRDTSLIIGNSVEIGFSSEAFSEYSWSSDYFIRYPDSAFIEVSPKETTRFVLTAKDTSGCFELQEDVLVDIIKEYTLDMPDAFSPNNDGINDVLYVKGWGIKELIHFEVFNRYGERIFYTQELSEGWDGKNAERLQNIETYKYSVLVRLYNNEFLNKTGSIKLLR
jgi:gliding motility-associated-like protein